MFAEILQMIGLVVAIFVALLVGGFVLYCVKVMVNHLEEQEREDEALIEEQNEAHARGVARQQILMRGLGRPNKQLSPAEWKEYEALKQPATEQPQGLTYEEKRALIEGNKQYWREQRTMSNQLAKIRRGR